MIIAATATIDLAFTTVIAAAGATIMQPAGNQSLPTRR
jgi:hypothetical protein